MPGVINVQRIVGVRDSPMRITARNIGQLPRRKLGKLGVKRNSESAVYNYAQSSALPRSGISFVITRVRAFARVTF